MKWKSALGFLGAIFLGGVLLVATWAKAADPGAFAEQIRLEQLDFLFSARTVTLVALALEAGLGTALFLGLRRLWILIPATLLVSFFMFLTGRNYWLVANGLRDPDAACGCFGSLVDRTAQEAFWQDLLMLVPPLALAYWGRLVNSEGLPWRRLAAACLMVVGVLVYAGTDPGLRFVEIAAGIGTEAGVERFLQTDEYLLVMEDKEVPEAKIYHSEESVSFLILSPQMPDSILLRARGGTVETIAAEMVSREADGSITLSSDAVLHPQGQFQVGGEGISFTIEGIELRLKTNSTGAV